MGWLEQVAGPNFAPAVLWTLLALVVLVIVLVIVRIVRSMTFGTFVAGGRNRKTRLAVMDAAAVDSQRRLVLVRRDDVEHLILIGGPTDVVVERDIRLHSAARRPGGPVPDAQRQPAAETQARRAPAPATTRPEQRPPQPTYGAAPPPAKAPPPPATSAPVRMPPVSHPPEPSFLAPRPAASQQANAAPAAPKPRSPEVDKALVSDISFNDAARTKPRPPEMTLEDEMNRLLGELSSNKR
jgi:hypothetical protein